MIIVLITVFSYCTCFVQLPFKDSFQFAFYYFYFSSPIFTSVCCGCLKVPYCTYFQISICHPGLQQSSLEQLITHKKTAYISRKQHI